MSLMITDQDPSLRRDGEREVKVEWSGWGMLHEE